MNQRVVGSVPAEFLGVLFNKTTVLEPKHANASPQSQTMSFVTGCLCKSRSCCLPCAESIWL